jgi:hypothetical protein
MPLDQALLAAHEFTFEEPGVCIVKETFSETLATWWFVYYGYRSMALIGAPDQELDVSFPRNRSAGAT